MEIFVFFGHLVNFMLPAFWMATLIVASSTVVCIVYALVTRFLLTRTQQWRVSGLA